MYTLMIIISPLITTTILFDGLRHAAMLYGAPLAADITVFAADVITPMPFYLRRDAAVCC